MRKNKVVLLLSFPLAALVIIVSCVGWLTPGFYSAETLNWQAQSVGQDLVDLFLVMPCLVVFSVLTYRNNKAATMIWGGVMLYLTYTFVLYCFDVHFNRLFLVYCLSLGLAFYSLVYFLITQYRNSIGKQYERNPATRFVGTYFIIISVLFYILWLSEIVPSIIRNVTPKSVVDTGLFTNGVHVIDLAIVLPAIFIAGVLLLRGKSFGFILAPMLLSFFILMDLTIGTLAFMMDLKGVESSIALSFIMTVLAFISVALLIWFLKSTKPMVKE